jgi:radical SAM-linked protein
MRCLERLFRRAGLPLGMSEGFHPKPRMSFPSALAVGIEGTDEVMELELAQPLGADEVLQRMAPHAPPGLALRAAEILPPGSKKAQVRSVSYQVPIPPEHRAGLPERIAQLLAGRCCPITRPGRHAPLDLRPLLEDLSLREGVLQMRLCCGREGSAHPREVLAALGLPELEQQGIRFTRTAVEIH